MTTSLQTHIGDLALRISTEVKAVRTLLNNNAIDNSALTTTQRGNLVAAINELKATIDSVAASAGAQINDAATSGGGQTYSIDKIKTILNDATVAVRNDILGGAGPAYDTLQELKDFLDNEAGAITDIMNALGNRVRFDSAQTLTTSQRNQLKANIDMLGVAEIGNPDTDFVAIFNSGLI